MTFMCAFTEMHSLRKSFCGRISSLVHCQTVSSAIWKSKSVSTKKRHEDNDDKMFERFLSTSAKFFSTKWPSQDVKGSVFGEALENCPPFCIICDG